MKQSLVVAALALGSIASQSNAALVFDANVTNDVIFGTGNANGGFTIFQDAGVELGLRAKLRHNASGNPENTFNSNGDGTYSFEAGVAPTQTASTGVWSFEWSINSNFDGSGTNLSGLAYELLIDTDPTFAQSFIVFDPINGPTIADHAIGNNSTGNGAGLVAGDAAEFASLISDNNIAQNSWKPHWFISTFDPTVDGVYSFSLAARDAQGLFIGSTDIDVIVGAGATEVSAPATLGLLGLGLFGLAYRKSKQA